MAPLRSHATRLAALVLVGLAFGAYTGFLGAFALDGDVLLQGEPLRFARRMAIWWGASGSLLGFLIWIVTTRAVNLRYPGERYAGQRFNEPPNFQAVPSSPLLHVKLSAFAVLLGAMFGYFTVPYLLNAPPKKTGVARALMCGGFGFLLVNALAGFNQFWILVRRVFGR